MQFKFPVKGRGIVQGMYACCTFSSTMPVIIWSACDLNLTQTIVFYSLAATLQRNLEVRLEQRLLDKLSL